MFKSDFYVVGVQSGEPRGSPIANNPDPNSGCQIEAYEKDMIVAAVGTYT